MATRRLEALLLIVLFLDSAAAGLLASHATVATYDRTYDFVSPMPQLSSQAPTPNSTITYPVPKPSPVLGQVSVLIIAVEFSDYNHTLPIEDVANNTISQLQTYYGNVSYGLAHIVGRAVGWIRVPHKLSDYGADNGPIIDSGSDNTIEPDTWRLMKDAAPMIVNQVNFAEYQEVVILHAGYGEESSRVANDIWSVTFLGQKVQTSQGTLDRFSIVPEFEALGLGTMGVYAHEFGHLLGLPDLYSQSMEQVGDWDLMARGAWNGEPKGSSPAEMLSWDRIFLGWLTPKNILDVANHTIVNATVDPIELPSPGFQAVRVHASNDSAHYYLIEVRQQIGFDVSLPSTGVLITYIDENLSEPVRVIDSVLTTSTLDDAPFQVGQKYSDPRINMVISITQTNGSSYSIIIDTSAPSPELVVKNLTVNPQTVHPNTTATLNIVIANEGNLNAKPFLVNIYLNETVFASTQISLTAGENHEFQFTWTPTSGGTYVFKVVLDPDNRISQSSNENKIKILTVVVGYTLTLTVRPPGAGGDIQWWLLANGVNQTFTGVGQFQVGLLPGPNTLDIQPLIYLNPSSRYVFSQWSDESSSNPRVINASADMSLAADFTNQYLLSLEPNGGETSSGGWQNSGTLAAVSATSPSNLVDKQSRLVFLGWSGDVESNKTSLAINMTRPYHMTASWKTQYYLQIESSIVAQGEGWYDANTPAAVSLRDAAAAENGTRHLFVQWSGDLKGVDPNQTIMMSSPKFVSAVWQTQYELMVESEYGHAMGRGWYAPNTPAVFLVDTPIIDNSAGTRRVFMGWSGDAQGTGLQGTVVMDGPKVIKANWTTQYQVVFDTRGIRNGTLVTITVDGQSYGVKAPERIELWQDAGSHVSFSSNSTVGGGLQRYSLQEWQNSTGGPVNSPQQVLNPETYTAVYEGLSAFPCIIATVTFGSEVSPEVQFLRNFRDHLVLSTRAGSAFMNIFNLWYYSFSPQVANYIATHDVVREPVRVGLYPLIGILELSAATYSALAFSPEFAILTTGILASALIGLVYLTPIDLLLLRFARRRIRGIHILKAVSILGAFITVTFSLGELTGSFWVLAISTSALVLITVLVTPFIASFLLHRALKRLSRTTAQMSCR